MVGRIGYIITRGHVRFVVLRHFRAEESTLLQVMRKKRKIIVKIKNVQKGNIFIN